MASLESEREARINADTSGPITMDTAYILAGGHGKYQKFATAGSVITFMTNMLYVFSIPFFVREPKLEYFKEGTWTKCFAKEICDNKSMYEYRYVHRTENFVSEYDLLCKDAQISYIATCYFVGGVFSCAFFSTFGDVYGRLPLLLLGHIGNVLGMFALIATSSYKLCLVLSALIGFVTGVNQSTPFNFVYDSMEGKHMACHASVLNASWASGQILIALIMATGAEWRVMGVVMMGFSVLFVIDLLWIIEPPRFYYSKGDMSRALEGLRYIAKMNGKTLPENIELDQEVLKLEANSNISFKKVFMSFIGSRKLLFRLGLMCTSFFCSMLVYYGISVNLQKFVGNMVYNGIFNAIAEILGVIFGKFMITRMGKKFLLMILFFTAGCGLLAEGFFAEYSFILPACISMYIAKFGSAGGDNILYIFSGEIFPTSVKSAGLAIGMMSSSIGSLLAPIAGRLYPLHMFILLACVAGFNALLAFAYPVKANVVAIDTVEQLENE
eukprot:TRINITY_DN2012_c0_g1_i3.p1 TRINITY_DN2012_c0_g1~~TRINITY_DN2012_c0_g1_i3.p1  ORF type:complete len:498 (+),score=113.06 TRINITY_DN2012_c0_g1_i3:205-1698(+)